MLNLLVDLPVNYASGHLSSIIINLKFPLTLYMNIETYKDM
jgi:hypothetical protein